MDRRQLVRVLVPALALAFAAACAAPPSIDDVPDREKSTVVATSPVEADGTTSSAIVVTVRNAEGLPIAGIEVTLSSVSSGVSLRQPLTPTDEHGIASGSATGTVPGEAVVRANAGGVDLRLGTGIRFLAPCTPGQPRCGEACVDLASDEDHCGACGNACPAGEGGEPVCEAGACAMDCSRVRGDCDGDLENGCETDLTDPASCGACENACPTAENAVALCEEPLLSRCGLTCAEGFGSCDSDFANGCEQPLDVDAHCGACGLSCPDRTYAHATGYCGAARTCEVACDADWGDCDENVATGCEQSLLAKNHCGACGNACPGGANAEATCLGDGACGLTCRPGFGDCTGGAADGCETNTDATLAHCGTCGNACGARVNAAPACAAGACDYTCAEGFADCNGDVDAADGDGCETDLSVGRCECQLSPTFASSSCLTIGTGARAVVGVQLRDGDGVSVESAAVSIDAPGLAWEGPVTELEPGLYVRTAAPGNVAGEVTVQLSATATACGGPARLRPVKVSLAAPAPVGPEGGIGGCASLDGNLRVKVVRAEDGTPIPNAFVMAGASGGAIALADSYPRAGVTPQGSNVARTGTDGVAEFRDYGDALGTVQHVTAGADGRAYATLAGVAAADVVLALPSVSAPEQARFTGEVTGTAYPANNNGYLELALVTPTLDMAFVSSFNILKLLSEDHAITASGFLCGNQSYVVAGNIHVPGQVEAGACSITGGETWVSTPRRGGPVDLIALRARMPIASLLAGGASVTELLASMEVEEIGMVLDQPTNVDRSGISVPLTQALAETMPVTVTGAPSGTGSTLYVMALGDLDGGNGSGRLYLESFRTVDEGTALTTTLETNPPADAFAGKTDLAGAISVHGLATSLVMDRTTLDRATPRTLTGFLGFPGGSVAGRTFTWNDVAGSTPAPELARSELRRVTEIGAYGESYEPFWIVWSPGDLRQGTGGARGFRLPTLPAGAPRSATGGYLLPSWNQTTEWFLALRQLGLAGAADPFRMERHALGSDTSTVTRVTTDRVPLP